MNAMNRDPFSGTWTLNATRSSMSTPLPRSWVLHIDATEAGVSHREEITDADGFASTVQLQVGFDGKEYAVTGSLLMDTIACTRPALNVITSVGRKAGAVTLTDTLAASVDGQVLTLTYSVLDGIREVASGVAVFERTAESRE